MFRNVTDALRTKTNVLNLLEWPVLYWIELLQSIFDLVVSTFAEEKSSKVKRNKNCVVQLCTTSWNP